MINQKLPFFEQLKYRLAYLWNEIWRGFFTPAFKILAFIFDKDNFSLIFVDCLPFIALFGTPLIALIIAASIVGAILGTLCGLAYGIFNAITRKPLKDYPVGVLTDSQIDKAAPMIIEQYENSRTTFASQSSKNFIRELKRLNNYLNEPLTHVVRFEKALKERKMLIMNYVNPEMAKHPFARHFYACTNARHSAHFQPYSHGKRLNNIIRECLFRVSLNPNPIRLNHFALLFAQAQRTCGKNNRPDNTQLGNLPSDVLKMILLLTTQALSLTPDERNQIIDSIFKPRLLTVPLSKISRPTILAS